MKKTEVSSNVVLSFKGLRTSNNKTVSWLLSHVQHRSVFGTDRINQLTVDLDKFKQEYDVKIKFLKAKVKLTGSPNKPDTRLSGGTLCASGN